MGKVKLTKGELKRQRDALRQYERYLPTLQLKKQQLQLEILRQATIIEEKRQDEAAKISAALEWSGLLAEPKVNIRPQITPKEAISGLRNIAGVDLPVFDRVEFNSVEYDLFSTPLWVDAAAEALRLLVSLREEIEVLGKGLQILRHELRITTQRVNLFEKIKIPQAKEAIRLIKIYLGDQITNAVGRSKIAKRKIEQVYSSV
ncbi:MAG: V-type ATP synthase subunit D [Candidatus Omnitrophica bacterium]|nr:V-type ATP synthase subunit D [Candidatus Omnitrophota bacterium]